MDSELLGTIARLLTGLAAIGGALFAAYKYFSQRERLASVRVAFREAVDSLGAEDPLHRRAGAIMLRRFFDEKTEQGGRGTPYADEALAVIAATLRGIETGPFQKLLADGLAYAPTLENTDLQKTNLQGAYIVGRDAKRLNLSGADFFRADLTGASLKGAQAKDTVFYQARLANTVFRDANLTGANFTEADLDGARFDGATLAGARFTNARNVPQEIRKHLDADGAYSDEQRTGTEPPGISQAVFLSKPGAANIDVRRLIGAIGARVEDQGFTVEKLDPDMYASTGAVAEVRRVMSACSGVVVVAVPDLEVREGAWRAATPQAREVTEESLATPWTSLELGLAVGLGIPVLLAVADGVNPDAFDFGAREPQIHTLGLHVDHTSQRFRQPFDDWCGDVRSHAARHERADG